MCRFEKCAFLGMFQIGTVQNLSYWGQTTILFFNHYIWSSPTFVTEKQSNKQTKKRNTAWPYFWSLFTNFYASGPCIYHATSIWQIWNMFQKYGTPCNSETCFRMAHVSERHATRARFCPVAWFPFCMARYREKTLNKKHVNFWFTSQNDSKFQWHAVIIWYCSMNRIKSNGTFCCIFLYRAMLRGNQHGNDD